MVSPPNTPPLPPPLDDVDRILLQTLTADARLANNRLAARAGVAPSTALARVKSLLDRRVIRRFTVEVEPSAVGRPVQAIVAVRLRSHDRAQIDRVMRDSYEVARMQHAGHITLAVNSARAISHEIFREDLLLPAQRDILKWVRRALDKRAVVVRSVFQDGFQWSVDEVVVLSPLHCRRCRVPRHFSSSSR